MTLHFHSKQRQGSTRFCVTYEAEFMIQMGYITIKIQKTTLRN